MEIRNSYPQHNSVQFKAVTQRALKAASRIRRFEGESIQNYAPVLKDSKSVDLDLDTSYGITPYVVLKKSICNVADNGKVLKKGSILRLYAGTDSSVDGTKIKCNVLVTPPGGTLYHTGDVTNLTMDFKGADPRDVEDIVDYSFSFDHGYLFTDKNAVFAALLDASEKINTENKSPSKALKPILKRCSDYQESLYYGMPATRIIAKASRSSAQEV